MKRFFAVFLLLSGAQAPATPPAAPGYVDVAWIANRTEFLVRWQPVSGATSYNVYRYDTNSSAWLTVATNLSFEAWNVLTFRDPVSPNPGPGTYAVTAVNGDGESASAYGSVVPGAVWSSFWCQSDWWRHGYTFIETDCTGDTPPGSVGMVEVSTDRTNFTHGVWHTNIQTHHVHRITNLLSGTIYYTRLTQVETNGSGFSEIYPWQGTYTLPLTPINVWEDQQNSIDIGDNTWYDRAQIISPPAHGTLVPYDVFAHWWLYTPEPNFAGIDTFEILDNPAGPPVTLTLNVQGVNDFPVASPFTIYVPEDSSTEFAPLVVDPENDPYSLITVSYVQYGGLGVANDTNFIYTPMENFVGTDEFMFYAADYGGFFGQVPVTGLIIVTNVNDAPMATNEYVIIQEDNPVTFTLGASDVDGDALTLEIVDLPLNGSLTNTGLTVTYTPNPNYWGSDYFTYRVSDGQTNSGLGSMDFTINPVNDAPVAHDKSAAVNEDASIGIALTGADIDNDPLTFAVVDPPQHGQFVDGVYTPAANYFGPDTFTCKANDGQVDSALATVTITVNAVNDAPIANGQSVSTPYNTAVNIVLTGSDIEGSALTFTTLTSPANGTLTGTGANRTFTPNIGWYGTTSFTFIVNDGALDSAAATVTITVVSPGSVPAAPSGLTATAISQNQINLAWTDNSANEDGFKIERSPNGNSSWTQIATVGPNVTTYSNTGLTKNTRYHYRVRAYNALGNSAYSNTANARTQN